MKNQLVEKLCCLFLVILCEITALSVQNHSIKSEPKRISHRHKSAGVEVDCWKRRRFLANFGTVVTFGASLPSNGSAADNTTPTSLKELAPLVRQARSQLNAVPDLIQEGKWDSVRAILITPPISDCWSKSSKLLLNLANAIGEELPDGDELTALEAREDVASHLRYLDMAVYNNNFNPIATEGETGATKELIRSYYEDPKNELSASVKALDELISMIPK